VTYAENQMRAGVTNILMGAQMLEAEQLDTVPDGAVVYNLEQMTRIPLDDFKGPVRLVAKRFPIWDYSAANLEVWTALGARNPQHVKIGWAAPLERIAPAADQDIDVLIYGLPGAERVTLFQRLCNAGIHAVFVCGLYGASRDGLIARSKLVVNAGFYESRIFEVSRVSYLLCNAKAVVSQVHPDTFVEPDLREAVHFAAAETIVDDCLELLRDAAKRRALEERGRAIMRSRDMRDILRAALARLPEQRKP